MEGQRLDKWLWHARFFKTRTLAARVVASGGVRVNGTRIAKPAFTIRSGDVLTFAQARQIRVIEIVGIGQRRGPAPEAQSLYVNQTPGSDPMPERGGRPAKKDRRALQQIRRIPT